MSIQEVNLNVNGRPVKLMVDPQKPLLKVLRDDLRLTGTKEGCNEGICGACMVLMDGIPTTSCKLPVEKAIGKKVLTIEGLGTRDNPDQIQRAFVAVGAAQCGYCTPGMILTTKALLDRNPNPTREEARQAIKRNLCRCTGYKKIIDGIMLAAELRKNPDAYKEPDIKDLRLGGRIPQLNSWGKVTGSLQFGTDFYMEDMCYAKVLRSPHYHARILNIDASEAEAMHGVVCVCTSKDLKGPNRVKYIFFDTRAIADDTARYWKEPVAIVVARTEEIAEKALEKIKVDYEVLPAVTDPFEALRPGAPEVQEDDYPGNVQCTQNLLKGDIEEGFKRADYIEECDYYAPANAHGYLEPDCGIGYIDDEGRVCLWCSGQAPHYHRDEVARVLGLGTDEVRVVENGTGGGFGARIDPFHQLLLGLAVYKARCPVKLQFTAEENFYGEVKRHPFYIKLKTGVTKEGKIVAHYGEILGDGGAYALASPGVLMRAIVHSYGAYDIENVKILGKIALTNNTPSSAMRGFGASQMCFAIEAHMNKICDKMGFDILEFAKKNGFLKGVRTATGQLIEDEPGFKEVIEVIQDHWAKKTNKMTAPEELAKLPPHIKRGKGFATTWYGIGKTGLLNLSRCNVDVLDDGRLLVREGASDIGQGVSTVVGLIAGEAMGMTLDQIQVQAGDSLKCPDSDLTCASKHTFYTGNATLMACNDLKEKLFAAAAVELEANADELDTKGGYVFLKEQPEEKISFADLKRKGHELGGFGEFFIEMEGLDPETGQGKLYAVSTYGACQVEVEVNTETGKVKVLDAAVAFQCGKAINRLAMEGQMEGGIGMGVGYALMEEYITGKTISYKDYPMPRSTDVPLDMDSYVIEIPQGPGPFGAIGMGEAAHFPMAGAIIAAIHEATGIWFNEIPITPEKVRAALAEQNK